MPLFVVVLLKRISYNKETKREVENKRSQSRDKKAITADFAPKPQFSIKFKYLEILYKFYNS